MSENVIDSNITTRKISAFDKRVHEIDFIRGLLMVIVIIDHIICQFMINGEHWYNLTGVEFWLNLARAFEFYWNCAARVVIREVVLLSFTLVSGISCAFSRSNYKRAALMIAVFALVYVGGNLFHAYKWFGDTNTVINFNIIGVLAFSTLFYCFVEKLSYKGLIAATLFWILFSFYIMPILASIPGASNANIPALFEPSEPQADWVPLVPYIAFFFIGAIVAFFIYKDRKSKIPSHSFERPICFIGRHSLLFYLGHEIILIPIFFLVTKILEAI